MTDNGQKTFDLLLRLDEKVDQKFTHLNDKLDAALDNKADKEDCDEVEERVRDLEEGQVAIKTEIKTTKRLLYGGGGLAAALASLFGLKG